MKPKLAEPEAHIAGVDPAFAAIIIFQQLAGRAARAIHGRFLALYDGHATADAILRTSPDDLRRVGLSGNKAASILDLASKTSDGSVPLAELEELADDEVVKRLTGVRGIGRWTAEMFMIFHLRRLDVWPVDDFGVRKGYAAIHALPEPSKPKELDLLGEIYRPYRSVAAWYCWRAVDTVLPAIP